jgi:hypothetical protein
VSTGLDFISAATNLARPPALAGTGRMMSRPQQQTVNMFRKLERIVALDPAGALGGAAKGG